MSERDMIKRWAGDLSRWKRESAAICVLDDNLKDIAANQVGMMFMVRYDECCARELRIAEAVRDAVREQMRTLKRVCDGHDAWECNESCRLRAVDAAIRSIDLPAIIASIDAAGEGET